MSDDLGAIRVQQQRQQIAAIGAGRQRAEQLPIVATYSEREPKWGLRAMTESSGGTFFAQYDGSVTPPPVPAVSLLGSGTRPGYTTHRQ